MQKRTERPPLTGRRMVMLVVLVAIATVLAVLDWYQWQARQVSFLEEQEEVKLADAGARAQFDGIDEVPCDDDDGILNESH